MDTTHLVGAPSSSIVLFSVRHAFSFGFHVLTIMQYIACSDLLTVVSMTSEKSFPLFTSKIVCKSFLEKHNVE